MCITAGTALLLAGGAAAGVAVSQAMAPKAPSAPDPTAAQNQVAQERAKVETDSLTRTNSKLAQRNRARAASSLLAKSPLDSTTSDVGALGGGKATLGA